MKAQITRLVKVIRFKNTMLIGKREGLQVGSGLFHILIGVFYMQAGMVPIIAIG